LLNEEDIIWLKGFQAYNLNDAQKRALIFVREVSAIDNPAYRQLNGCDSLRASGELRQMRDMGILAQKGKGRATYYVPDQVFIRATLSLSDHPTSLSDHPTSLSDHPISLSDHSLDIADAKDPIFDDVPEYIQALLGDIGKRINDKEKMNRVLLELCTWKPMTLKQLAAIVNRNEKYLLEHFIIPLRENGHLAYTIPDMPNHPEQAYRTI
jgi:ATP-dependent DNA helicase RecG